MAARSTRIVRNGCGYVYQIPCEDKVWLEEFLYKNQTAIIYCWIALRECPMKISHIVLLN